MNYTVFDQDWLNNLFAQNPKATNIGLGKNMGLTAPQISKMRAGTRTIKGPEVAAIRSYFINFGNNIDEETKIFVPEITESKSNAKFDEVIAQAIPFWGNKTDKMAYFKIRNDNLSPLYNKDDVIFVDLEDNSISKRGYISH